MYNQGGNLYHAGGYPQAAPPQPSAPVPNQIGYGNGMPSQYTQGAMQMGQQQQQAQQHAAYATQPMLPAAAPHGGHYLPQQR